MPQSFQWSTLAVLIIRYSCTVTAGNWQLLLHVRDFSDIAEFDAARHQPLLHFKRWWQFLGDYQVYTTPGRCNYLCSFQNWAWCKPLYCPASLAWGWTKSQHWKVFIQSNQPVFSRTCHFIGRPTSWFWPHRSHNWHIHSSRHCFHMLVLGTYLLVQSIPSKLCHGCWISVCTA